MKSREANRMNRQDAKKRGRKNSHFLVPKLCLGTDFRETLFRVSRPASASETETEFRGRRSQTEFGNEKKNSHFVSLFLFLCSLSNSVLGVLSVLAVHFFSLIL